MEGASSAMSDQQSTRQECPVTAQELREIANSIDRGSSGGWAYKLQRMRALVDWLDEKPSPEASAASEPTRGAEGQEPTNPLPSFDARVWARSFMEHNAINPGIARDEETMVTWFATTLMRGYDEHAHRQPAAPQSELRVTLTREAVMGAIGRAWCHPDNTRKEMDVVLADAATDEIMRLLEGAE